MFFKCNTASLISPKIDMDDMESIGEEIATGKPYLFIRSPGGTSNALLMAMGFIAHRQITTIGDDLIASAALDVFLCGKKRLITPETRLIFHQSRTSYEGRWILADEALQLARISYLTHSYDGGAYLFRVHRELSEVDHLTAKLIGTRTALEYSRVLQLMEGDGTELSTAEAVYYGFADAVIPETMIGI